MIPWEGDIEQKREGIEGSCQATTLEKAEGIYSVRSQRVGIEEYQGTPEARVAGAVWSRGKVEGCEVRELTRGKWWEAL